MKRAACWLLCLSATTVVAQPARAAQPPPAEPPPAGRPPAMPPVETPPVNSQPETPPLRTPPASAPPPLSEEGATQHAVAAFESIDADHDGYLSTDELNSSAPALTSQGKPPNFAELDKNGDGRISRDEWGMRTPARNH